MFILILFYIVNILAVLTCNLVWNTLTKQKLLSNMHSYEGYQLFFLFVFQTFLDVSKFDNS